MTTYDATGRTSDPALNRQIARMIESANERKRTERETALNYPWRFPDCAVTFAVGKLSRIVRDPDWPSGVLVLQKGVERGQAAEELREAAHYLLHAAALLEPVGPEDECGEKA